MFVWTFPCRVTVTSFLSCGSMVDVLQILSLNRGEDANCAQEVSTDEPSGLSSALVFMIAFVIILLVAGLAFIGYMYWRLYTLQTAKARRANDNVGNINIQI